MELLKETLTAEFSSSLSQGISGYFEDGTKRNELKIETRLTEQNLIESREGQSNLAWRILPDIRGLKISVSLEQKTIKGVNEWKRRNILG